MARDGDGKSRILPRYKLCVDLTGLECRDFALARFAESPRYILRLVFENVPSIVLNATISLVGS